MRRFVVIVALVVAATCGVASPGVAAKKPRLPKACVEALRAADELATLQDSTSRAGAKVAVASGPFVTGNPSASAQALLTALQTFNTASDELQASIASGQSAITSYRDAAAKCRAQSR